MVSAQLIIWSGQLRWGTKLYASFITEIHWNTNIHYCFFVGSSYPVDNSDINNFIKIAGFENCSRCFFLRKPESEIFICLCPNTQSQKPCFCHFAIYPTWKNSLCHSFQMQKRNIRFFKSSSTYGIVFNLIFTGNGYIFLDWQVLLARHQAVDTPISPLYMLCKYHSIV